MVKILIIEDEFAISQVLKAYLQKVNYQVEQAYDGEEALNKFHTIYPDLVLLDVMLPGKDGWEILREIRMESNCPVIMLTALGEVNHRLEGLNEGQMTILRNPLWPMK